MPLQTDMRTVYTHSFCYSKLDDVNTIQHFFLDPSKIKPMEFKKAVAPFWKKCPNDTHYYGRAGEAACWKNSYGLLAWDSHTPPQDTHFPLFFSKKNKSYWAYFEPCLEHAAGLWLLRCHRSHTYILERWTPFLLSTVRPLGPLPVDHIPWDWRFFLYIVPFSIVFRISTHWGELERDG